MNVFVRLVTSLMNHAASSGLLWPSVGVHPWSHHPAHHCIRITDCHHIHKCGVNCLDMF